jgi:predicted metal-dependent hydrolase
VIKTFSRLLKSKPCSPHKPEASEVIQTEDFTVIVRRSKRTKSASIRIKEASTTITVPTWVSRSDINALITEKSHWINKQLSEQRKAIKLSKRDFIEGESFFYRGQPLTLTIQQAKQESVIIGNNRLTLYLKNQESSTKSRQDLIQKRFQTLAQQHLIERTRHYAEIVGVTFSDIRVKTYKSRWGSCSSLGLISYNWKIIIAPDSVIDYIVIHELCHLVEHNHSTRFWALVEQFQPHYKQQRDWLRKNGLQLTL